MFRLKQLTLLLGDLCALYLGLFFALTVRYWELPQKNLLALLGPMSQLFVCAVIIIFIAGLYDITRTKNTWHFFRKIIISMVIWAGIGVLYFYINAQSAISPKTILALTAGMGFGLMTLWRYGYNRFISTAFLQQQVLFVGATEEVNELKNFLLSEPQSGYNINGIISAGELRNFNQQVDIIVLSPQLENDPEIVKELYKYLFNHTSIVSLADFYESVMKRIPPFTFSEGWFIANIKEQHKKIYDRVRLFGDYFVAICLGIFFIITFPILAFFIKISSPGPVFFRQKRTGRLGKPFTMYKYRTMKALASDGSAETEGPRFAESKDSRITVFGKFLRSTRLDEIPQFINILKADMAVIGPRPERPEFVEQLTEKMPYYSLRHLIKPGLTGWAQVHKAYYGTIEENLRKLEYDLFYIKNRDFLFDISILLRTVNILSRMIGR